MPNQRQYTISPKQGNVLYAMWRGESPLDLDNGYHARTLRGLTEKGYVVSNGATLRLTEKGIEWLKRYRGLALAKDRPVDVAVGWWYSEASAPNVYLDEEALHRAGSALVHYVNKWNLPLNPEDLDEMAGTAVLAYMGVRDKPAPR